jgi:hypothetical protein
MKDELHKRGLQVVNAIKPSASDLKETSVFREAIIRRLVPPQGPPLSIPLTAALTDFVSHHELYASTGFQPDFIPFFEAAHNRLWLGLEDETSLSSENRRLDTMWLANIVFNHSSMPLA